MIDLASGFTLLVSKKILGNKSTYLIFLFMIPLVILSPNIIIPYTDTITMWIPIAIFYFYLKIKDNDKLKYLYILIEGILLIGGYLLKPTCIIIGIAIILTELLYCNIKKENILKLTKKLLIYLIVFLLGISFIYSTFDYFKKKNISQYITDEEFENNSVTATHFLMMGMQESLTEDNKGKNNILFGAYNGEDVANTKKLKGKKEKQKYNIEIVKQRLQDFGFFGYIKFVYNKMMWILSDGTFYYGAEGTFFVTEPYNQSRIGKFMQSFFDIESDKYQLITVNIIQITWVTLMIGIIYVYKNIEKNLDILKFSIIGIILFIIIFEGRSRYLYNYIPIFIIVGTVGIKNIIKGLDKESKKWKKRKYHL